MHMNIPSSIDPLAWKRRCSRRWGWWTQTDQLLHFIKLWQPRSRITITASGLEPSAIAGLRTAHAHTLHKFFFSPPLQFFLGYFQISDSSTWIRMTSLSLLKRDCSTNLLCYFHYYKKTNLNLPPLLSFMGELREKGQGGLESRGVKVGQSSANFTVTACWSKGVFFFSSNRSSVCSVKKLLPKMS